MTLLAIDVQPNENVSHFRTTVILPSFRDVIDVDGAQVVQNESWIFDFYTNTSDNAWYFDIEKIDETVAVKGLGLATGVNLLYPYRHLALPTGQLFIRDKQLNGADPDVQAFAEGRAALYYFLDDGQ